MVEVELSTVTTQNGVVVITYAKEEDFKEQIGFLKYSGQVGVITTRERITKVFAFDGVLYKFEQSNPTPRTKN